MLKTLRNRLVITINRCTLWRLLSFSKTKKKLVKFIPMLKSLILQYKGHFVKHFLSIKICFDIESVWSPTAVIPWNQESLVPHHIDKQTLSKSNNNSINKKHEVQDNFFHIISRCTFFLLMGQLISGKSTSFRKWFMCKI